MEQDPAVWGQGLVVEGASVPRLGSEEEPMVLEDSTEGLEVGVGDMDMRILILPTMPRVMGPRLLPRQKLPI